MKLLIYSLVKPEITNIFVIIYFNSILEDQYINKHKNNLNFLTCII